MAHVRAQVIAETADGVVVELRWRERERATDVELYQVLRLQDGKIVDMQDFERRRAALRAAAAAT